MKSEGSGYSSARDKGFSSHLSVAFDSLAAGKTGIREELPLAPSFPGLIPSPLPHLSMPEDRVEQKPAFLRGKCLGIRARWNCGSGFVAFLLFFTGQQNLRQELPAAKTWADLGFVEPKYKI